MVNIRTCTNFSTLLDAFQNNVSCFWAVSFCKKFSLLFGTLRSSQIPFFFRLCWPWSAISWNHRLVVGLEVASPWPYLLVAWKSRDTRMFIFNISVIKFCILGCQSHLRLLRKFQAIYQIFNLYDFRTSVAESMELDCGGTSKLSSIGCQWLVLLLSVFSACTVVWARSWHILIRFAQLFVRASLKIVECW